jgi:hypothetical protein
MELLERERCLADLAEWLATVAVRGGCIALIGGEAGIGKTAVLQEFSSRQRVARVLWGACDALFTPRPLAPLHDMARQTQGALLAAINSAANRDVIFAAALDELERAQTLVVFEDMHWADEATLRAVATRVCKRYVVVTVFMVVSGMSYRKGTFQAGRIVPRRVQTRIGGIIQFAAEHYLDWMRSFAAPIKGAAHLPVLRELTSSGATRRRNSCILPIRTRS